MTLRLWNFPGLLYAEVNCDSLRGGWSIAPGQAPFISLYYYILLVYRCHTCIYSRASCVLTIFTLYSPYSPLPPPISFFSPNYPRLLSGHKYIISVYICVKSSIQKMRESVPYVLNTILFLLSL